MSSFRTKITTGIVKKYYEVENEFDAVGTLFINWNMYYTAAHPTLGLWLCTNAMNVKAIVIGFIQWSNIKRVVVDKKSESVFIVVNDYESLSYFWKRLKNDGIIDMLKEKGVKDGDTVKIGNVEFEFVE